MKKLTIILGLVFVMLFSMFLMASAIKIAPYSQPLHDIMHWDKASAKLIIMNPEGERQTIAWASTVDLWNYNGNVWTYDLPSGDKFAFSKRVDFNISTTEGTGSTVRSISLTDTVGAALAIHEGVYSHITSAFMTGAWTNAVVGVITYSATGSAGGGMAAPICSEMNMQPAASSGGSYYNVHSYFNVPTNAVLIDSTAFNYAFEAYELAGGAKGEFDDWGDFWRVSGLAPEIDHVLSAHYLTLRIVVAPAATPYDKFLVLSHEQDMLSIGTSGNPVTITAAGLDKLAVYTTSALDAGVIQSVFIQQTMTLTSNTNQIEALHVELISDVKLGEWANAIMGKLDFVDSGLVHGIASVYSAELSMPAVTAVVRGTYAMLAMDMDMPTGCDMGGNPVSLFNLNIWGGEETEFDDHGYFFNIISGVTSTAGGFFYDSTVGVVDGFLRILIEGVEYYILLADDQT